MKSLTFTLVFTLAILNIASLADASTAHNSNRILKKRIPAHLRRQGPNNGGGNGGFGAINAPPSPSVAPQDPTGTAPTTTAGPATTAAATNSPVTTTTTSRRGGGLLGGVVTILDPEPTTSTTSTTVSTAAAQTTSTTTTTSSTVPTVSNPPVPTSAAPQPLITNAPIIPPPPLSTTTSTVTGPAAAEQSAEAAPPPTGATSRLTRNTIIIIVAIAGSIGVVALIWTIIRKWKFSPSSSFEDRMQPIDWQPTADDGGVLPHRARPTSHGSFGSADYHNQMDGRSRSGHGNDSLVGDLPPHDLLASSNQVGGGYTDMHRGPSPPMTEGVQRGASLNRGGQYDRYHDAYDYNGTGLTRGY